MTLGLQAVLYNLAIMAAVWTGALLSLFHLSSRANARAWLNFSAGLFLGVAFLHMIPDAMEKAPKIAGGFVLLGFLAVLGLERWVMVHPCEEGDCDFHHVGTAAFVGLSIHSFMNGVALGASLLAPGLGLAVFLATFFHKLPESFSLGGLFALEKRPRRQSILYIIPFSLMVPFGTLAAIFGLPKGNGWYDTWVGAAVAFSAGMFLQIATGDLLARAHREGERLRIDLTSLLTGATIAALLAWLGD